nr:hypothetical protein [Micromonospora sp. DSM 115978]
MLHFSSMRGRPQRSNSLQGNCVASTVSGSAFSLFAWEPHLSRAIFKVIENGQIRTASGEVHRSLSAAAKAATGATDPGDWRF